MTAALVALAHGSRDPRSSRTVRDIVRTTQRLRPDIRVQAAFLEHNGPGLPGVVDRLVADGHGDIVVVPLFLTSAFHVQVDVPAALEHVRVEQPDASIRVSDVLGLDLALLAVLDQRLQEAWPLAGKAAAPDSLVLVSAGSSNSDANAAMANLAQVWGVTHDLPTRVAFATASAPSAGEAVRGLLSSGHRHVAVGSFFIAPGMLADRATELALEGGATAVSASLGAHADLSRLILARYSAASLHLVDH